MGGELVVDVLAAAMNPAMSSWLALRARIAIQPGQEVLVLGATGNAGRMAAEIVAQLPVLAAEIPALTLDVHAVPLSEVERAWSAPGAPGQRVVFTP